MSSAPDSTLREIKKTIGSNPKLLHLVTALELRSNLNGWQLAKMKKSIPDMSLP